ncbi:Diadenosine tetraphosphate (Ap4A) hydrolase [Rhodococcus pyridinivorans]|uniref:HIT family protein n=1 Tax=Rhodococcus pyridinivorans TaxID=103816 RepID=UPI0007CD70F2|nr:HIT family protein [Rhodococcus pyridinivorans]QXF81559.1 HIT family protein [Rhodococcus pyridinivorans]SED71778.1 Diadenosine tetraphosphate (Ap4A) hydrolase [Rhodococcus pyridinivorans]
MTDCIFCAIVAGQSPASVVLDDPDVLAFMDIRPFTPGHLLVIPKRHASGLAQLDPDDGAKVFTAGQRIATAMRASDLPIEGVNMFLADGAAAGQEVFHVHLHLVPRSAGDGFGIRADWRTPNRTVLDGTAATIRTAVQTPRS